MSLTTVDSGLISSGAITLTTQVTGTLPVANGGSGVTTSTGTGAVVLGTSPTLSGTPLATTAANSTNTTQIATTAFAYGSLSLATNGYTKLANGLILQWGVSGASSGTITFPIAFPTSCLNVIAGLADSTNYCTYPGTITSTTFTFGSNGPGGFAGIRYLAIGY